MTEEAHCEDCGRRYGADAGFPDLIIPYEFWRKISTTGDENGLLCPSCICMRLTEKDLSCVGAFASGPIRSQTYEHMSLLRDVENIRLAIRGRTNAEGRALIDLIQQTVNEMLEGDALRSSPDGQEDAADQDAQAKSETIKTEQPNPLLRLGDGKVSASAGEIDSLDMFTAGRLREGIELAELPEGEGWIRWKDEGPLHNFAPYEGDIECVLKDGTRGILKDGMSAVNWARNPLIAYRIISPPETPETEADAQEAADNSSGEEIRIGMTESGLIADGQVIEAETPQMLRENVPLDALISVHADGETYATFGGTTYHVTRAPEPDTGPAYDLDAEESHDTERQPPSGLQSPEDETGELQLEQPKSNNPNPDLEHEETDAKGTEPLVEEDLPPIQDTPAIDSEATADAQVDLDPSPTAPEVEPERRSFKDMFKPRVMA